MKLPNTFPNFPLLWLARTSVTFAQQSHITECSQALQDTCQLESNRTCYYYHKEEPPTHSCGYCLNGFIELKNECYDIASIPTEKFVLLAELLEEHLPEYVDPNITTEQRAERLQSVGKVISFWNSRVPPPAFTLGLNKETFLTLEERKKRLGVLSDIRYEEIQGIKGIDNEPRGELERFRVPGFTANGLSVAGATSLGEKDTLDYSGDDDYVEREEKAASDETSTEGESTRWVRRRFLEDLPTSIDWEASGFTTVVKNQGLCGCCWAVSTAAAIESALLISDNNSTDKKFSGNSLSFQQMISCDEENNGCNGGNILYATRYSWIHDDFNNGNMGGLVSYADYPYENFLGGRIQTCELAGKTPEVYLNAPKIVTSVNDRSSFEERKQLTMVAVAQQPITSVIRSGCDLMMNYRGGVMTHDTGCECCATSCIDHAVVIVGYDTTAEVPYWKLRNSWGVTYGEGGYFKIAMNDPGCGWGLFGMLAESALPADVYTSLKDLPEREYPSWWQTAQGWEKALVIFASVLGFCLLCGCMGALWQRRKSSS